VVDLNQDAEIPEEGHLLLQLQFVEQDQTLAVVVGSELVFSHLRLGESVQVVIELVYFAVVAMVVVQVVAVVDAVAMAEVLVVVFVVVAMAEHLVVAVAAAVLVVVVVVAAAMMVVALAVVAVAVAAAAAAAASKVVIAASVEVPVVFGLSVGTALQQVEKFVHDYH